MAKAWCLIGYSGIKLVDVATGKVKSIDVANARDFNIALTTECNWVAAQLDMPVYDASVNIWDTKTGTEVASLPGRGSFCKGLAFSPDTKRLLLWSGVPTEVKKSSVTFGHESKVALACIDINSRVIIGETTVGTEQAVALCSDGETVALEAADHKSVRVRHLPTSKERCVIPVKGAQFAFSPDGKALLTIDENGQGSLWDVIKGKNIRDLEGALGNKDSQIMGISKNNKTIAVLDGGWHSKATVVVWKTATGKRVTRPVGHDGAVTCIAYAPGGKLLASGSRDKTVRLWNPATGEHLRILTVHKEAITAVAISPDGKLLASSSRIGVTRLSNMADGKLVAEFTGPHKGAQVLTFSPEGTVLFAGGHSPEVLGWQIAGAKEVVRLKTGDDGEVMAFGDGGALALTANGEFRAEETPERLQIWNPTKKLPVASLDIHDKDGAHVRCEAAIFSPGGRMIASSQITEMYGIRTFYGSPLLRLWERDSGQPIRTLAPTITHLLAFSPNGRLLASGGIGKSGRMNPGYGSGIDIWDTVTGEKAGALPVTPECIAFSPDGLHLATGGRDHCVLIWEAPKIPPAKKATAPSAAQCDAWWIALGSNAKDAYKAIGEMIDNPEHAVTMLKERVRPVQLADPATVTKLIAQFDRETFAEREDAQKALEKMEEGAEPGLTKALQGKLSPESRRRIQELLSQCEATSTLGLQHDRAVATLEWIGTPAARALLRTLADGAPRARLTMEARAALKRL